MKPILAVSRLFDRHDQATFHGSPQGPAAAELAVGPGEPAAGAGWPGTFCLGCGAGGQSFA